MNGGYNNKRRAYNNGKHDIDSLKEIPKKITHRHCTRMHEQIDCRKAESTVFAIRPRGPSESQFQSRWRYNSESSNYDAREGVFGKRVLFKWPNQYRTGWCAQSEQKLEKKGGNQIIWTNKHGPELLMRKSDYQTSTYWKWKRRSRTEDIKLLKPIATPLGTKV